MKKRGLFIVLLVLSSSLVLAGILFDRFLLDKFLPETKRDIVLTANEMNLVDIADKASQSVVTVSIKTRERRVLQFSPFGGFREGLEGGEDTDIGSGFVATVDGLIITNKHVVSDVSATYKVITKDDTEYDVVSINRDPNNDIAILKISANNLVPLGLGDSANLKVGQSVIAIGTALGEFRHTVTTGVISGLGRGITAGSAFEGFVEKLDGVIQTDAAINPGNSGGPLLNSSGQVIGVNVAVAQGAENIGFAIPIDIVKDSLNQFQKDGKFTGKPFLGVRYEMISKRTAVLNDVPQGAYVVEVVASSPAEKAGIQPDDIITKIDDKEIKAGDDISNIIKGKKIGDTIKIEVYRGEKSQTFNATLTEFTE